MEHMFTRMAGFVEFGLYSEAVHKRVVLIECAEGSFKNIADQNR